jgi:hypothetical protein
MDKTQKKKIEDLSVYPLLVLEEWFPHELRHRFFKTILLSMSFFFMIFAILFSANRFTPVDQNLYSGLILAILPRVVGIFLLLFSLWMVVYLLESFHRAVYFHNRAFKIKKRKGQDGGDVPYEMSSEVATVFYFTENGDIIKSLFNSPIGFQILVRCGFLSEEINEFLRSRENILQIDLEDMYKDSVFDMEDFALFVYKNYPDFADFLFKKGVGEKDFTGAVRRSVRRRICRYEKLRSFFKKGGRIHQPRRHKYLSERRSIRSRETLGFYNELSVGDKKGIPARRRHNFESAEWYCHTNTGNNFIPVGNVKTFGTGAARPL